MRSRALSLPLPAKRNDKTTRVRVRFSGRTAAAAVLSPRRSRVPENVETTPATPSRARAGRLVRSPVHAVASRRSSVFLVARPGPVVRRDQS